MAVSQAPEGVNNIYVPLAELKARAGITGTASDGSLWLALFGAARAIDRFCNRHFYVLYASRTFDLDDPRGFVVPDLVSVTALREDSDGDRVFETTRASGDYLLYPSNSFPDKPWGLPYNRILADPDGPQPTFPVGRRTMQVEGEWSYRKDAADTGADLNEGGTLAAASTSFTVTDGSLISAGQTLLVESEQMFVRQVSTNTVTAVRGVNGTTAASHADSTDISVFRYPAEVAEASILMAGRLWKRKDTPYGPTSGAHGFGVLEIVPGMDPDVHLLISPLRRLPLGAVV